MEILTTMTFHWKYFGIYFFVMLFEPMVLVRAVFFCCSMSDEGDLPWQPEPVYWSLSRSSKHLYTVQVLQQRQSAGASTSHPHLRCWYSTLVCIGCGFHGFLYWNAKTVSSVVICADFVIFLISFAVFALIMSVCKQKLQKNRNILTGLWSNWKPQRH